MLFRSELLLLGPAVESRQIVRKVRLKERHAGCVYGGRGRLLSFGGIGLLWELVIESEKSFDGPFVSADCIHAVYLGQQRWRGLRPLINGYCAYIPELESVSCRLLD